MSPLSSPLTLSITQYCYSYQNGLWLIDISEVFVKPIVLPDVLLCFQVGSETVVNHTNEQIITSKTMFDYFPHLGCKPPIIWAIYRIVTESTLKKNI